MRSSILAIIATILALPSCTYRSQPDEVEPGVTVDVYDPSSTPEAQALLGELQRSADWTVDDFLQHYAPTFQPSLAFDPSEALHLDLIAGSSLALDADESARLAADGFVVTDTAFPSFVYGYHTIYMEDLPVFVTADAILFAMHRSYDAMLRDIESSELQPALESLIDGMRRNLKDGRALGYTPDQELDLDLTLAVAGTLLSEAPRPALVGADQALVDELVARAVAASGAEERVLFGSRRQIDWSQFAPRGHYAGDPTLERYFRAMMWLGRVDFRMLEPDEQNGLVLHRRQVYDTLAMADLLGEPERAAFEIIHETIGAFVGEPDGLVVTQVPDLVQALGISDPKDVTGLGDAEIAAAIQKHQFGAQRIASHYMVNGAGHGTKPLAHSFALLGQRYVLDAHVFTNVVYDRIAGGSVRRMMPSPLDAAFAALANDHAAALLQPELQEYGYQHELDVARQLADAHGDDFWQQNLYNRWLGALRTLSPSDTPAASVAGTEAWGRRLLNTQLASWAELRHDTILYAKQSYTAGAVCEYPDAYVEPNPAFFAAVEAFARHGRDSVPRFAAYFDRLEAAASRLRAMAEAQQTGLPHSADDVAWINEAVVMQENCDGTLLGASGWYGELFYANDEMDFDPTIADVHTQPTDAAGNEVGRVLHVGTGNARAIVATFETCEGPRAYVGLTSSYYEHVTEGWERLTDEDWARAVNQGAPVPPAWAP